MLKFQVKLPTSLKKNKNKALTKFQEKRHKIEE